MILRITKKWDGACAATCIEIVHNVVRAIQGGLRVGGGFDRGVPESAQFWLLFHNFYTVSCLAGSKLYSFSVDCSEHKGTRPRGAPPQKCRALVHALKVYPERLGKVGNEEDKEITPAFTSCTLLYKVTKIFAVPLSKPPKVTFAAAYCWN